MDTVSAGHGPDRSPDPPAPDGRASTADLPRTTGSHDTPSPARTADVPHGAGSHPDDAFRAVLCGDGLHRCPWAPTGPAALEEHDHRWGAPPVDSPGWFEALSLEIFQAGLARWSIAQRRDGLRRAFRGFVAEDVAELTEDAVDELLLDPAVIRNRVKIEAVVHNARVCAGLAPADWADLAGDRPEGAQPPRTVLELTRRSPEADRLAARLKELGLVFVGRTTAHGFLLRTGVLPGHLEQCFRTGPGTAGSG
ncbi:DNA-3-methyladenine glycosylase I [Kocuria sediminis]|uniref:DNA-3-methyladenine glycosylase I n=1 Tax=Kocuria sediminis TaxID=1038857 RepID=A0A6N8GM77_9MICC|nr:DNA-3-methyladenine glycosylase I [Kocuria sediminis]MUN62035.1 DNA-3-methyladenine glycosylase I [Kocuria sediminis]